MASVRAAQGQQRKLTTRFVCFPVLSDLTVLALHQEDVSKMEPGVTKSSVAKVIICHLRDPQKVTVITVMS